MVALIACGACTTDRPPETFATARARDAGPSVQADGHRDAGVRDAGDAKGEDAKGEDAKGEDAGVAKDEDAGSPPAAEPQRLDPVEQVCGNAPTADEGFTRENLRAAAARCAAWHYCGFRVAALDLERAMSAYEKEQSASARASVRAAYVDALRRWSRAELFQFGPASSAAMSAGKDTYQGRGIRDRIYAWPAIAPCRVEEQILMGPAAIGESLISGRGLFAIEHAVFGVQDVSACPEGTPTATSWSQQTAQQRTEGSVVYAAAAARDVREQVDELLAAFEPDAFVSTFISASGYPNEQEALNVLGWSLIYVERELKDWKLGIPAGYTMTAPVTLAETPHLQLGTELMRENLAGFRALFEGCGKDHSGLGFDDWLQMAGHEGLAADIVRAAAAAEVALQALPPLPEASASELDAAYQAVRALTVLLKAELFGAGSPLGLKLPASVEGDTD